MGDIRRRRKDHRLQSLAVGHGSSGTCIPWSFTVPTTESGQRTLDFGVLRTNGRDELARSFRDAVWRDRERLSPETLDGRVDGLSMFIKFLDHRGPEQKVERLGDIDSALLTRYVAWLKRHIPHAPSQAQYYGSLKAVLLNCSAMASEEVHDDLRNMRFPKNLFTNKIRRGVPREPYSGDELRSILRAVVSDHRRMVAGTYRGPDSDVVTIALLMLAYRTALNPTSLLELRRDCLSPHPLDPTREILTSYKRRGHSIHRQSFNAGEGSEGVENVEISVLVSVGNIVRMLRERSSALAADAPPDDRDFLMLYRGRGGREAAPRVRRMIGSNLKQRLHAFVDRHRLKDVCGKDFQLQLVRFRRTGAESFHRINGGDALQTSTLMGHARPDVTSQHYLGIVVDDHLTFKELGRRMEDWALPPNDSDVSALMERYSLSCDSAWRLLSGEWNTSVARCSDPYNGGRAPKDGTLCLEHVECFRCRNMVIVKDDLHRLYSFYERLRLARDFMAASDWAEKYRWVVKMIDEEIAPRFDEAAVANARRRAAECPHPIWAGDDGEGRCVDDR